MYMTERERMKIIQYFLTYTNYDEDYLLGIENHAQLFSMYKRTQERMASYPREIIAFYNAHPEIYVRPSDEEIMNMKYEELSQLRRDLGLTKKRGKKVTSSTPNASVADKARSTLRDQSVSRVAANVIITNRAHEEDHDYDHEQFLTPEEIAVMYPDEELSADDLAERGIIVIPYSGVTEPITRKKK